MTNNQKKLFNISNRIEKLLYDKGNSHFQKIVNYSNIIISTQNMTLDHNFIEKFVQEITVPYNVNFLFFIDGGRIYLKIY